jgi:hypothetical protein
MGSRPDVRLTNPLSRLRDAAAKTKSVIAAFGYQLESLVSVDSTYTLFLQLRGTGCNFRLQRIFNPMGRFPGRLVKRCESSLRLSPVPAEDLRTGSRRCQKSSRRREVAESS